MSSVQGVLITVQGVPISAILVSVKTAKLRIMQLPINPQICVAQLITLHSSHANTANTPNTQLLLNIPPEFWKCLVIDTIKLQNIRHGPSDPIRKQLSHGCVERHIGMWSACM